MAKKLTNRKPLFGNNVVPNSEKRTKRKQNLNLQTKTIDGNKVVLTNREWRTLNKEN